MANKIVRVKIPVPEPKPAPFNSEVYKILEESLQIEYSCHDSDDRTIKYMMSPYQTNLNDKAQEVYPLLFNNKGHYM